MQSDAPGRRGKIYPNLRIADLAFDVNLIVALKRGGFTVKKSRPNGPTRSAPKVSSSLFRTSLVMFLSTFRVRLVYTPFYQWFARCAHWRRGSKKTAPRNPGSAGINRRPALAAAHEHAQCSALVGLVFPGSKPLRKPASPLRKMPTTSNATMRSGKSRQR